MRDSSQLAQMNISMKPIILFLWIFMAVQSISNATQLSPDSTTKPSPIRTREDTLKALDNFNKRIHKQINILLAVDVVGLAASGISIANKASNSNISYLLAGFFTGSIIANCILLKRFNKRHFKKIVTDYRNGKRLPYQLRSRLKEKDFK